MSIIRYHKSYRENTTSKSEAEHMYNQNFDKIGLKRRWKVGFPCLSRNEWLTISDGPSYHFLYFGVILIGKLMDSIEKISEL